MPERHQGIFQSEAAALDEARRGRGVAIALGSAVGRDVAQGKLARVTARGADRPGAPGAPWYSPDTATRLRAELPPVRRHPRAAQAMLRGAGVSAGRVRPAIHVTLWS